MVLRPLFTKNPQNLEIRIFSQNLAKYQLLGSKVEILMKFQEIATFSIFFSLSVKNSFLSVLIDVMLLEHVLYRQREKSSKKIGRKKKRSVFLVGEKK